MPEPILAFRGAEGFGKFSLGGRGGAILHVTTLDDNGNNSSPLTGSFRWALLQQYPRHIVFDVAGYIDFTNVVNMTNANMSYCTVHGHLAPGDGVTWRNNQIVLRNVTDIVFRFMRGRVGPIITKERDALDAKECSRIMIDHCSFSWGTDELCSLAGVTDTTMQWCMLSEALNEAGHSSRTEHGYGSLSAGKNLSIYKCLFAHNFHRNPRFAASDLLSPLEKNQLWFENTDVRNCVVYNWKGGAISGGGGGGNGTPRQKLSVVRNLFIPGPAFQESSNYKAKTFAQAGLAQGSYGEWYLEGNWMEGHPDVTADNKLGFLTSPSLSESARYALLSSTPFTPNGTYIREQNNKNELLQLILDRVGKADKRDAVDLRIINDVITRPSSFGMASGPTGVSGTGGMIDHPDDRGGYPSLSSSPSFSLPSGIEEGVITESGYDQLEEYSMSVVADLAEYWDEEEPPTIPPVEPPIIESGQPIRVFRFPSEPIV